MVPVMSPAKAAPAVAATRVSAARPVRAVRYLDIEELLSDIFEGERLRQARVAQRHQRLALERAAESRQKHTAAADQGRGIEQGGNHAGRMEIGHHQPV